MCPCGIHVHELQEDYCLGGGRDGIDTQVINQVIIAMDRQGIKNMSAFRMSCGSARDSQWATCLRHWPADLHQAGLPAITPPLQRGTPTSSRMAFMRWPNFRSQASAFGSSVASKIIALSWSRAKSFHRGLPNPEPSRQNASFRFLKIETPPVPPLPRRGPSGCALRLK